MNRKLGWCATSWLALLCTTGCGSEAVGGPTTVTVSGSVLGKEGEILRRQLERFDREHPEIRVELRPTPDAADQRHQLYVQWLNARASDPDVLQLDAIWTPEFAAAGWILPLDRFAPDTADFFPATSTPIAGTASCTRCRGSWTSACSTGEPISSTAPPATWESSTRDARRAIASGTPRYGLVWQGARYEGLGHRLPRVPRRLRRARSSTAGASWSHHAARRSGHSLPCATQIHRDGIVPARVLTWQEEQTRFAFQNGQAAFMRNWPYAVSRCRTAPSPGGRPFAVAPMPAGAGRTADRRARRGAARHQRLQRRGRGGLAGDRLPHAAGADARAGAGRRAVSDPPASTTTRARRGAGDPAARRAPIIEAAVPRPVTPVYTQLSEILQIQLHRALSRQAEPAAALAPRGRGDAGAARTRAGWRRSQVAGR